MGNESIAVYPGRFWGYAYLKPRTEKRVRETVAARNIPVYLPLQPKARMHHSTKITTYHPMLPGYIFLCLTDDERRELKASEKHIVQIELLRDRVQEEKFIEELKILQRCEILAQSEPVLINPEISVGDEVEVISGSLKGLRTTVLERGKASDTVSINLTLLNISISCQLPAECLRKTEKHI